MNWKGEFGVFWNGILHNIGRKKGQRKGNYRGDYRGDGGP